jgi:hypothetical protein
MRCSLRQTSSVFSRAGSFIAAAVANYPWVRGRAGEKQIVALYSDSVVPVGGPGGKASIDVVNAKHSTGVVLDFERDLGEYGYEVKDCQGQGVKSGGVKLTKGLVDIAVPVSGLVS